MAKRKAGDSAETPAVKKMKQLSEELNAKLEEVKAELKSGANGKKMDELVSLQNQMNEVQFEESQRRMKEAREKRLKEGKATEEDKWREEVEKTEKELGKTVVILCHIDEDDDSDDEDEDSEDDDTEEMERKAIEKGNKYTLEELKEGMTVRRESTAFCLPLMPTIIASNLSHAPTLSTFPTI